MVITQCKQCQKYFDSEAYEHCPMCGAHRNLSVNSGPRPAAPASSVTPAASAAPVAPVPPAAPAAPAKNKGWGFGKKNAKAAVQNNMPAYPTGNFNNPKQTPNANVPVNNPVVQPDANIARKAPVAPAPAAAVPDIKPEDKIAPETQALSIEEEVKKATADADGKTFGYFSLGTASAPAAAPASDNPDDKPQDTNASQPYVSAPVVGWLVCVKGAHFGESFKIEAGRNSVGRNDSNSIVLSRERSVSREKHAWVVYEPKKKEFFVSPGESSGLTYYNGDNIFQTQKLSAYDSIELGEAGFVFVPLCSDLFDWEKYINKK